MRYLLFLCLSLVLTAPTAAQPETTFDSTEVTAVEYTVLEELEYDQGSFLGGRDATLRFRLVELRNVDSGQVIEGVEVSVAKQENQVVGGSIGGAVVGSMFGASTNVTYRRIRESGHIFLRGQDLREVNDFLSNTVGALGKEQSNLKVLKVSLQQGFELGMMYDPDASVSDEERRRPQTRPRWSFIVSAEDATYRLAYQDGTDVIRKLSEWEGQMEDN